MDIQRGLLQPIRYLPSDLLGLSKLSKHGFSCHSRLCGRLLPGLGLFFDLGVQPYGDELSQQAAGRGLADLFQATPGNDEATRRQSLKVHALKR